MRELTTYELEAELLPARELMGSSRSKHVTITNVYNQGSFDGNGNVGLLNVGNGSLDGNNVFILWGGGETGIVG